MCYQIVWRILVNFLLYSYHNVRFQAFFWKIFKGVLTFISGIFKIRCKIWITYDVHGRSKIFKKCYSKSPSRSKMCNFIKCLPTNAKTEIRSNSLHWNFSIISRIIQSFLFSTEKRLFTGKKLKNTFCHKLNEEFKNKYYLGKIHWCIMLSSKILKSIPVVSPL